MNSRALRRLAADHGALHRQELPPNYLFAASTSNSDDLTQLDIFLAGPTHTPFASGVWKLHLSIPPTYPQQPPTANFRTPIFHPNVDPQTGGVCVETLKRDWDSKLTLRDVLVTISCLLIQPNPDSALNAEAGALIQEDYLQFSRRAELMTSIHAVVPKSMQAAVREAQNRGQEAVHEKEDDEEAEDSTSGASQIPARRRRTIAKVRSMRRSEASPSGAPARRLQQPAPSQSHPFVFQSGNDDVFGASTPQRQRGTMKRIDEDDNGSTADEQENDDSHSENKGSSSIPAMTSRRPLGVPVPLGELTMEPEPDTFDSSEDMEPEYPPSPRKSPSKSPSKRRQVLSYDTGVNKERPESSRDAALRGSNVTPPNLMERPLAADSPFMEVTFATSSSPKKRRGLFDTPPKRAAMSLFDDIDMQDTQPECSFFESKAPSSAERRLEGEQRRAELDSRLWALCGEDIDRWNRGDFDGQPFKRKAGRW